MTHVCNKADLCGGILFENKVYVVYRVNNSVYTDLSRQITLYLLQSLHFKIAYLRIYELLLHLHTNEIYIGNVGHAKSKYKAVLTEAENVITMCE